jgi:LacI family transcriptional regulator
MSAGKMTTLPLRLTSLSFLAGPGVESVATIKDVAREAAVSIKTVSRVVNRDPAVRPKTREKVELAIAELNYVPDSIARSLRNRRTNVIGIITDFVMITPHSVGLMSGIQDASSELGLGVLTVNTKADPGQEVRAVKTLVERRVDAILYVTVRHMWLKALPILADLPTVLVNCTLENSLYPAIVPDDYQGGYDATKHLIDLGHRDIAMISLIPDFEAAELRGDAYKQALADHGLAYRAEWVQVGQERQGDDEIYTTQQATETLLGGSRRPSAIVCGKDELAMRVYNSVRTMGFRIPDDVSIIGYDNFVNIAENLDPQLTTVALPYYQMGRQSVDTLYRQMRGDCVYANVTKVPCPLIERESCRNYTAA